MAVCFAFSATSYRADAFVAAAASLPLELVLVCDLAAAARRHGLPVVEVPLGQERFSWGQGAHDGALAADELSAPLAAAIGEQATNRYHTVAGALAARDKRRMREQLTGAVPVPAWAPLGATLPPFPVVVKPRMLSGSQGVLRADDDTGLSAAIERIQRLLARHPSPLRALSGFDELLVEAYVDGPEIVVEGLMHEGELTVLAIFDKPDPLVGPTFEETIYVAPSIHSPAEPIALAAAAARRLGLDHGPIHAELRLTDAGPVVIEVAARSIGGLCSRVLSPRLGSLERRLLRHAAGLPAEPLPVEPPATGVMMIPVPKSGVLRAVSGLAAAREHAEVSIAVAPGESVRTLPEGNRYLGFIFAYAPSRDEVLARLRRAHAALHFELSPLLQPW